MKKHARMEAFVAGLATDASLTLDPCYQGYFRCFNEGLYYEAHDVLEHLWLGKGRQDANFAFYKGLIQVAGAFVHLKKQAERPRPRQGRPAAAARGAAFRPGDFQPRRLRTVSPGARRRRALRARAPVSGRKIAAGEFTRNPWSPRNAPQLELDRG